MNPEQKQALQEDIQAIAKISPLSIYFLSAIAYGRRNGIAENTLERDRIFDSPGQQLSSKNDNLKFRMATLIFNVYQSP
ncbi:MAG: hypothetical protein KME54_21965 [Tolypothrix brevis GSE-NOS-MK-07-07A]|jgi:hypothetical protein|nr:hypothetical protein [Tolypothrix brevis GSE-NOS-MK-07-07A]